MDTLYIVFYLVIGLVLLVGGAEGLIRGGSSLALSFGVSPLIIGLTLVAFGTSSPELVVSIKAAVEGNADISLGNVIGSNIANIGLILGIAVLIQPVAVRLQIVKKEIPIMIGFTLLFFVVLLLINVINIFIGIFFLLLLLIYTSYGIYISRKEEKSVSAEEMHVGKRLNTWLALLLALGGLAFLAFGADLFLKGAVELAKRMGVSDIVIGLTIVAVGTSLPELFTTVYAAIKKEADIALGNVVGSNIFNILGIIGVASVVNPIQTSSIKLIDLSMMLIFSIAVFVVSKTGLKIQRTEGIILLSVYLAYVYYLIIITN
ncbi:MAG: calcium/sodium antiporter [Bacteroidetes bacterium]|nr:calcium/sodium antiporter [Bacteroidota bacterium]